MSTGNTAENETNKLVTNYNTAVLLLGHNTYIDAPFNNSTYDDIEMDAGTLMGRITSTDYVDQLDASQSDGTEKPLGVLSKPFTLVAGGVTTVTMAVSGRVRKDKIILRLADQFTDDVDGQNLGDLITQIGITMVDVDDLTEFDNQ